MNPSRPWVEWLLSSLWALKSGTGSSSLLFSAPIAMCDVGRRSQVLFDWSEWLWPVHGTGVTDEWPGGDFASCESFRIQAGASLNNLLGGFSSAQWPSDPLPPLRTERRWDLHTHTLHTRTHTHAHITTTTKAATGNWPSSGLKSVGGAAKGGQVGSSRKGCFVGKLHGGEERKGQHCWTRLFKILVFLLRGAF